MFPQGLEHVGIHSVFGEELKQERANPGASQIPPGLLL